MVPAMRKSPVSQTARHEFATSPAGALAVLSVSPMEEDHSSLQSIIAQSNWMLFRSDSLPSALTVLRQQEIAVVICERDLQTGTWVDVLEHINALRKGESLIVTSRLADERLWGEALNLGAWDVLAKPFDQGEVIRSVKSAWHHWRNRIQMPALAMKAVSAA